MVAISTTDTAALLKQSENSEVQEMAKNTAVVAGLTRIFNASLEMAAEASKKGQRFEITFAQKGLELLKITEAGAPSDGLKIFNTLSSVSLSNVALVGLKNASPSKALAVGAMVTVEKLMILGGLGNKHQCEIAITSLAATTGLTLAAAPTGVGLLVGVIGVVAQSIETYGACKAEGVM